MTEEEKQIWRATYAASSAIWMNVQRGLPRHIGDIDFCHCAIADADQAIISLRLWREVEDPQAGLSVSS